MSKFWIGLCIGIIVGAASLMLGVMSANAQTAQTTVTVIISEEVSSLATSTSAGVTASVACNEINCSEQADLSLWTRFTGWLKNLL